MDPSQNSRCSIDGCDETILARGWCNKHYLRWYRNGSPATLKRLDFKGTDTAGRPRRIGTEAGNWRGGRHVDNKGYVRIYVPVDDPMSSMAPHHHSRYCGEHRLVMARSLGRPLKRSEHVHHKNGKRDDNRLENLELVRVGHGPGQSVEDLVVWAKEILADYEPEALAPAAPKLRLAS